MKFSVLASRKCENRDFGTERTNWIVSQPAGISNWDTKNLMV